MPWAICIIETVCETTVIVLIEARLFATDDRARNHAWSFRFLVTPRRTKQTMVQIVDVLNAASNLIVDCFRSGTGTCCTSHFHL